MPSISPEFWQFIPGLYGKPFGYTVDVAGGRSNPYLQKIEIIKEKKFDEVKETSRGLIEFRNSEGGFNVLAVDLGIGLIYDKNGHLETMGINLLQYSMNVPEEDMEKLGGLELAKLFEEMVEREDHLYLNVDLVGKIFAVVNINSRTGEESIVMSATDIDYSKNNLAIVDYMEHRLFVNLKNNGDEFNFAIKAREAGEDDEPKTDLMVTRILSDCNIQTFVESSAPNKMEVLARRIFIA